MVKARIRKRLLTGLTFSVLFAATGNLIGAPVQDASVPGLEGSPAVPRDARGYWSLGNRYLEEGRSDLAADAYGRALALDRREFYADERTQMAIRLSWENRLSQAADELEAVLAADPRHLEARVHLARVRSWDDDLGEAIRQADRVLAEFPDHPDALLIKADALEWQGRSQSAIPLYRRSIARGETFEARVGLAYALLASGDRSGATEQARSATATVPAQEERLRDLLESIDEKTSPAVHLGHSYYRDSDDNRVYRTRIGSSFGIGNSDFSSTLSRTETTGPSGSQRSEGISIGTSHSFGERLQLGGGVDVTRFEGEGSFGHTTGRLELGAHILDGEIGVRVTRDVLVDTVELVRDRTRATRASAFVAVPVAGRVSLAGEYGRRQMSDGNRADDVAVSATLAVTRFAGVGYRVRLVDYERTSAAYFAPSGYVSHRLTGTVGLEGEHAYVYAEVFVGPQRFERNGFLTNDLSVGGWLSLGFRPASFVTIELNGESGDLATGSVSGFNYYSVGPRISFHF